MDFVEVEAMEGLRWPWNSLPATKSGAAELVVPPSVLCTVLPYAPDLPLLRYDPLACAACSAVLNPYARVLYPSALWLCPFCCSRNPFPHSYAGIADHNLPPELFPTSCSVEYLLGGGGGRIHPTLPPAFVFVVDVCAAEEELAALKREVLRAVAALPESAAVGLVSFGERVLVHDLGFTDCSRAVVFLGERELSPAQV